MSRLNRYKFIKRMYPEYLIVFETNFGYKYEGIDKDIMMNFCHSCKCQHEMSQKCHY